MAATPFNDSNSSVRFVADLETSADIAEDGLAPA